MEGTTRDAADPGAGVRALRAAGLRLIAWPRWCGAALAVAWMGLNGWLSSGTIGTPGDSAVFGLLANLAHAPLFGLLALWWIVALPRRSEPFRWAQLGPQAAFLVWCAAVAWGAIDEWHQSHVAGRDASVGDLLTDGVAAAAVLAVALYIGRTEAGARGLWARLLLGALACVAAATLATAL